LDKAKISVLPNQMANVKGFFDGVETITSPLKK
jgi:hypothetical protein